MNYLAHQYLSFQNEEIQLGNLYGEIVRGKDFTNYPKGIQLGIKLHRSIDTFTDQHEVVKRSSQLFHKNYGKYSPVIIDVFYDYFLIRNWNKYSEIPLEKFIEDAYALFRKNFDTFPPRLQYIIKYMLKMDWFRTYQTKEGVKKTLEGISQRAKFENNIEDAVNELNIYEEQLDNDFNEFFPEIINYCKKFIETETNLFI